MTEIFRFQPLKKKTKKKRVIEVCSTKNFIKDKMTGRVDKFWWIVEIIEKKKVKIEVTGP